MSARSLALCGVLTALAEVVLLLGGVIPMTTFCAPLLAMAVLLPVLEECGTKAAAAAWAATALLALLLTPDRESALIYLFFGWYPLLRPRLRGRSRAVSAIAKLAVYSAAALTLYGLVMRLIGLADGLPESAWVMNAAAFLMGGVLFFLVDQALERLTHLWHTRLRPRLFRGS